MLRKILGIICLSIVAIMISLIIGTLGVKVGFIAISFFTILITFTILGTTLLMED